MSEFNLAEIIENGLSLESFSVLKEKGLTFTETSELIISPRIPIWHCKECASRRHPWNPEDRCHKGR